MTYYNTIPIGGKELKSAKRKTNAQEDIILRYFKEHSTSGFTPYEIWKEFPSYPITSIRRAITNLSAFGYPLEKTGEKKIGGYGAPNNVWRLSPERKDNEQLELFN